MKLEWKPELALERYFTPTRFDRSSEIRKARIKNHNLSILQMMYNGDPLKPLRCVITKRKGFVDFPCLYTNVDKQRFDVDFNHIRQRQQGLCVAGDSIDKRNYDPSSIFRSVYLDKNPQALIEFMTIMPVCQEYHRYITQDSALGHITLTNFQRNHWPWVLKNATNFNKFCKRYNLKLDYQWFIDHLSNIDHPGIGERLDSSRT